MLSCMHWALTFWWSSTFHASSIFQILVLFPRSKEDDSRTTSLGRSTLKMKDVGCRSIRFKTAELSPSNDNFLTCPERNCLFSILSASDSVKNSISPMYSGNFLSYEQPAIIKSLRDFILLMLSGRFFRPWHPSRFKKTRFVKFPIDWCTSTKLEQFFRISFSRLELCKFGVLIRYWEWLRSRIFSFSRICQNRAQNNKN